MEFIAAIGIAVGVWWVIHDWRRERKAKNSLLPDDWFEKFEEDLRKWQRR